MKENKRIRFVNINDINIFEFNMPKKFYSNCIFILKKEISEDTKFFKKLVINHLLFNVFTNVHTRRFIFVEPVSYEYIKDIVESHVIDKCYWSNSITIEQYTMVSEIASIIRYGNRNITIFYDDKDCVMNEIDYAVSHVHYICYDDEGIRAFYTRIVDDYKQRVKDAFSKQIVKQ